MSASITGQQKRHDVAGMSPGARRTTVFAVSLLLLFGVACGDYGGGSGGGGGTTAAAPPPSAPGVSDTENQAAFEASGVYGLLTQHCSTCHVNGPGFPAIAHDDPTTAYRAVWDTQKVNLRSVGNSRLVLRLSPEQHQCWSNCADDADEMMVAVQAWADAVAAGSGGTAVEGVISSAAASLANGVEDTSNERYEENVIALYDFKEGGGDTAFDKSDVMPAMDLTLQGDVNWMSNYGVDIVEGSVRATREASRKLYDRIADPDTGSQQFAVEAWVIAANVDQEGPARIITYSQGTGNRNFTVGQNLYNYVFRNRALSDGLSNNGTPALETYDDDQDLQATLQHVVMTMDQYRGRRVYVNGRWTDDVDEIEPGRLFNWNPEYTFLLGNETGNDRPWEGKLQLVAIYDYALTDEQIQQNFDAGIGKRLLLRFDLGAWLGAGSYMEYAVTEFDEFSYLFCAPKLVTPASGTVRVGGMRVAVNGQAPVAGQAFSNTDVLVTSGQTVSETCSIISKSIGPDDDVFHLEFEYLGTFEDPEDPGLPLPLPPPTISSETLPDVGVRSFSRINDSMAALTSVDPNTSNVRSTYQELEQQLPSTFDLRTFTSSAQVGIAKLALEYCDTLVESPGLRGQKFPGFDFGEDAVTALNDPVNRDRITDPLIDDMVGIDVVSQPDPALVEAELDTMIDELIAGCSPATCGADRTQTVVKAACSAVLSSAVVSIH